MSKRRTDHRQARAIRAAHIQVAMAIALASPVAVLLFGLGVYAIKFA